MPNRFQEAQGFTLTEALIAVAILAGLMAVLAPAVCGAVKAAVRVEQTSERAEDLRHISELLDRLAAGCVWPSAQTGRTCSLAGEIR